MILLNYICLLLASWTLGVLSVKLPDNWKLCPKTGNEECLKTAIQEAIIDMKDGNKRLSVLPLDPMRLERMEIAQGGSSPVNINLTFYDVDLLGFSRLTVKSAKADWDEYTIDFDFDFDSPVGVDGDYSIDGKVLVLPIQGNGRANVTFTGFKVKQHLKGSEYMKKGKKYMKIDESKFYIDPERVYVNFGNLFNGVPNLGDNMNKFLNENWKVILDELKETIASAMGQTVLQIANAFFKNVPVDHLYKS